MLKNLLNLSERKYPNEHSEEYCSLTFSNVQGRQELTHAIPWD